jgi:hypothetical protein
MAGREIIRDLERIEREEEREAVPRIVEAHLAARESALASEVAALRRELGDALARLEQRLERIEEAMMARRAGSGAERE